MRRALQGAMHRPQAQAGGLRPLCRLLRLHPGLPGVRNRILRRLVAGRPGSTPVDRPAAATAPGRGAGLGGQSLQLQPPVRGRSRAFGRATQSQAQPDTGGQDPCGRTSRGRDGRAPQRHLHRLLPVRERLSDPGDPARPPGLRGKGAAPASPGFRGRLLHPRVRALRGGVSHGGHPSTRGRAQEAGADGPGPVHRGQLRGGHGPHGLRRLRRALSDPRGLHGAVRPRAPAHGAQTGPRGLRRLRGLRARLPRVAPQGDLRGRRGRAGSRAAASGDRPRECPGHPPAPGGRAGLPMRIAGRRLRLSARARRDAGRGRSPGR